MKVLNISTFQILSFGLETKDPFKSEYEKRVSNNS